MGEGAELGSSLEQPCLPADDSRAMAFPQVWRATSLVLQGNALLEEGAV